MRGMQPGRLTEYVTIQRASSDVDDEGGEIDVVEDVARVWAEIRPLSGRERMQAGQIAAPANYRMTIYRRDDLTEDMSVVWGKHTLNIAFIGRTSQMERFMSLDLIMGVPT